MPLPQPTKKTILLFCFALLFSISGIGQSSNLKKREPILGQFLNAETVIDGGLLKDPQSVFVSDSGNVFAFDSVNSRIQKFKKGANTSVSSIKENANSVFVDKSENLYTISQRYIKKWQFNSKESVGKIVAGPTYSAGIWISDNEDIFLATDFNGSIEKWVKDAITPKIVAGGNGKLYAPLNLVLDKDSVIYIASNRINKIQKWDKQNNNVILIAEQRLNDDFSFGKSGYNQNLFVDLNKILFTLDDDKILKWKPNSTTPEYVFGQVIGSNSKLNYPQGFTIDKNGDIYIADTGNNRILKVNPNVKIVEKSVSQKTLTEYNGAYFLTQTNDLIAKIIPDEANLTMGEVAASVVIDAVQDQSFVKRHYKIETNNPAHKSKISLYFTQAEFDEYNKLNDKKLPANSTDKTGIANVIVTSSNISTGRRALPIKKIIEIPDNQIVWNQNLKVWEVSFEDRGSKEYWLKTKFEHKKSTNPRRETPIFTKKNMREGVEEIEVFESKPFEIYPNPVSNSFSLQINDTKLIGSQAFIKNEVGVGFKTIQISKKVESITVENWPAGIYFVEFANGQVGKFLKE